MCQGGLSLRFGAKVRKLAALLSLACLFQGTALAGQPARVWAVNDGEKVERDDLTNRNRASNSAWDGRRIKIFGARNEVVAFQVVVEAGAAGIGELRVALPELKMRGGGGRIRYVPPAADPTDYAGRPVQLFSVNYMNVTETTRANWVWRPDSPAAPADTTGWKPVQLVLFDFTLPDENSMHAMVYYEPLQPELYQGRNLGPAYHRFAHRHRVELVHAYSV